MRIGIDASCWIYEHGHGRFTREIISALAELPGHELLLFIDQPSLACMTERPEGPHLRWIPVWAGAPAVKAASVTNTRSLHDLWAMRRAILAFQRQMDVFFFPSPHTFIPLSRRCPVVFSVHDAMIPQVYPSAIQHRRFHRILWKIKNDWGIRSSEAAITVSETARQRLVERWGMDADRLAVIPNGVGAIFRPGPVNETLLAARWGIQQPFVLYVGSASPHKNLPTLVTAFAAAAKQDPSSSLELVLAGEHHHDPFGADLEALQRAIHEASIDHRVRFTGHVQDQDLVQFYRAASVVVLPSFDEGFGLPVLEAMACGTPVIASRAGALPEVMGDAGLLFNPYSAAELTARLVQVVRDTPLRSQLVIRGLDRAKGWTWETSARKLLDVFHQVRTQSHDRPLSKLA
jgi:glycosyltransferase involved in cell wall biosynthesis